MYHISAINNIAAAITAAASEARAAGYDFAIETLQDGLSNDIDFPHGAQNGADYLIDQRERALATPAQSEGK